MEKAAIDFHEAQFVSLPGQSNIYGLLSLKVEGTYKLVVATVRGQVFCLEYQRGALRPPLLPINFTYIPGVLNGYLVLVLPLWKFVTAWDY